MDEDRRITTVRTDRWKLIRYPGQEEDYLELYDLEQDPQEKVNIAAQHPEMRDELLDELKRWEHDWALGVVPTTNLDAKAVEQMRALGYLGD